jgi:hypothetical protein
MSIDLLCYLSGLSLSWGLPKLNWWNLVFSTSGGVGVFDWVWRLVWFALVWGVACFIALILGGSMIFAIEKPYVLIAALLSFKLGICHPYGLIWGGSCASIFYICIFLLLFSCIFFILT